MTILLCALKGQLQGWLNLPHLPIHWDIQKGSMSPLASDIFSVCTQAATIPEVTV